MLLPNIYPAQFQTELKLMQEYLYNPDYKGVEPLTLDDLPQTLPTLQGDEVKALTEAYSASRRAGMTYFAGINAELYSIIGDSETFTWGQYREAKARFYDKIRKNI